MSNTRDIAKLIDDVPQVCILYQFVHGVDLKKYAASCPKLITIEFVEMLTKELLRALHAMKKTEVIHGDLHEGNIMVTDPDPRFMEDKPRIKVTDFGIGTSDINKEPKDDYHSVAAICKKLVIKYVDPATLEGEDRFFRNRLLSDFLSKQMIECNVTVGNFVRNPKVLLNNMNAIRGQYNESIPDLAKMTLVHPFDYLSCEHFGDSFELLQNLYSQKFPGYQELLRKINTILTGPRGCGKTTIFRNLSLKTQLLGKKSGPQGFVGIYYHCSDLTFAFPYKIDKLSVSVQKTITHYFNLAMLFELLDTLVVAEETGLKLPARALERLQGFMQGWLASYNKPPADTKVLRHLLSVVSSVKQKFRDDMDKFGLDTEKWVKESCIMSLTPQDFLLRICRLLSDCVPWIGKNPFYFFLDDYSSPKVSKKIQYTLHNFILNRYSELFFKISTESIVSFFPRDSKGKLFEEGREYEVIDLGDYFLHASIETKKEFLGKVINNRLNFAEEFEWECDDIEKLLGKSPHKTCVKLAEDIKAGKKVRYSGWETCVGLCSGDIANILRLIRNILSLAKLKSKIDAPISSDVQNESIKVTSREFLEKLKAIPNTGPQIAKIVTAFGEVANDYLRKRRSKNVSSNPPYQAFRLELLEDPKLDEKDEYMKFTKANVVKLDLPSLYDDLIKYGAFMRDVRGKSQRGIPVPRLYLRRLLIPTFLLTSSKRDHIRVNAMEFRMLLTEPETFKKRMIAKPYRETISKGRQKRLVK